jgi:hypothetical protein
MAAGVHFAESFGGVGKSSRLHDWQRVHIGPQADRFKWFDRGRESSFDDANDTGSSNTFDDFVATKLSQASSDKRSGSMDIVKEFWVLMNIPAPFDDLWM